MLEKSTIRESPLIIGIVHRFRKVTAVRHDGEALGDDDDDSKAKKAA